MCICCTVCVLLIFTLHAGLIVISCAVENFGSGLCLVFIKGSYGQKILNFFICHSNTCQLIVSISLSLSVYTPPLHNLSRH